MLDFVQLLNSTYLKALLTIWSQHESCYGYKNSGNTTNVSTYLKNVVGRPGNLLSWWWKLESFFKFNGHFKTLFVNAVLELEEFVIYALWVQADKPPCICRRDFIFLKSWSEIRPLLRFKPISSNVFGTIDRWLLTMNTIINQNVILHSNNSEELCFLSFFFAFIMIQFHLKFRCSYWVLSKVSLHL